MDPDDRKPSEGFTDPEVKPPVFAAHGHIYAHIHVVIRKDHVADAGTLLPGVGT